MEQFNNTLNLIRDKLRVEGITGMDSINHCLAFVVLRYLTINKCKELNIPEEYAFENFMLDKNTKKKLAENDQRLLEKFYYKTDKGLQECLIKRLKTDGNLYFTQLNFKVKSPIYFSQILNALYKIDLDNLVLDYDIVGIVYEFHLKTGTSNTRDLGQFFTNREVIKYMIKLCDPKLKKNGEIESILDPSMGTGGFLTMSIKHLNEKYKNKIDWDKNKNSIYGFDIDENVKNFALLNTLLECEKDFSKTLVHNDSLKNDYLIDNDNKTIIDKVDIILANEPFGLKNIIHANCCKRIKDLKIEGTKAEPLFLQLMMQSLNVGGRCAVIIPDGVLFNDAKLYKLTRKYLCDKLKLAKVISLEDGLFLNTGVKSSILFFVNDGETKEVEFCKIKISSGEIVEELIIKVNIEEIKDNDYSLFVNKYNKVEEEKLDGIEYKKLGEICEFLPKSKRQASFGKDSGKYPFFTSSKDLTKFCDDIDYKDTCLIIGTGGNANIKISNNFSCSTDNFIIKNKDNQIINNYLYYWFINNMTKLQDCFHGSTIKHISKGDLENIKIPIPPLSSQEQIVEALDLIYDTIEGNSKLIQNYEKIKKGIIWSSTFNVEKKKLGDIFAKKSGKSLPKDKMKEGEYPVIGGGANYSGYHNEFNYNEKLIFIARVGSAGYVSFYEGKCYVTDLVGAYSVNKDLNFKCIYNILKNNEEKIKIHSKQTAAPSINLSEILELIKIPIPSKEIQEYIVTECEYYDNLIDTLKKENERLQNNKIIETVLKSVSNDNQLEESKEKESDEELTKVVEEDKPIKLTKESKSKLKN
jgi:type I restriction-modification system DNA methylase subunit